MIDPVAAAQSLIRCPSVTPEEGGALDCLQAELESLGFECWRLPFSDVDTPDVDNLFARIGSGGRHLCFAGHTDVVPPGDESLWTHPPFSGTLEDGVLHGRGAVDMKGNVACWLAACAGFLSDQNGVFDGSVSLLITGDEEGPSINGTRKVLEWMDANGHIPDFCIVGEPSCTAEIGDVIKNGRRGSLNGVITVRGIQGHSAYPEKADNPVVRLARIVDAIMSTPLDAGTEHFQPSTLQVTTMDVGNPATNVIPAEAVARFNVRFNTEHSPASIEAWVRERCNIFSEDYTLDISVSGDSFVTSPGGELDVISSAIAAATGIRPELSTGGGTSDARFVKNYCQVVEFGLVNKTIHAVDERVGVDDLYKLTAAYAEIIRQYFTRVSGG
ncbi:MAG: succinyl-diaminopimelate desuccinylase [Pseudomonadota bacterium]